MQRGAGFARGGLLTSSASSCQTVGPLRAWPDCSFWRTQVTMICMSSGVNGVLVFLVGADDPTGRDTLA